MDATVITMTGLTGQLMTRLASPLPPWTGEARGRTVRGLLRLLCVAEFGRI